MFGRRTGEPSAPKLAGPPAAAGAATLKTAPAPMKQAQSKHALKPGDQTKEGQEALFNLQTGMREMYGNNERGNQILVQLEEMLKDEKPLDPVTLQKLMDALQHFSVETFDHAAGKPDKPEVTNIDPTRLPPAYRGRIQKYFQKLSEK